MLILGVILAVIGWVTGISLLWIIGIVLIIVGGILWLAAVTGPADRRFAGRRYWY